MRKFLVIAIPTLSLILFSLIMLSGGILKKTSVNGMNIPETIQLAVDDIKSENWNAANEKSENLSNTWDKVVKRIQYSSERDEINSFNTSIAHLKGAIAAQDKSASLMALNEAYEHWDGVGR